MNIFCFFRFSVRPGARFAAAALCWPILIGSCVVSFAVYSAVVLKEKVTAVHVLAVGSCLAGLFLLCR